MKIFIFSFMACLFFLSLMSPARAGKRAFLKLESELISADLERVPLKAIIKRLEKEKRIWFKVSEALIEERISVQFTDLSLEEGLKRILSSMNYSLIFKHEHQLEGVLIVAKSSHPLDTIKESNLSSETNRSSTGQDDRQKNETGPFRVKKNSSPPGNQTRIPTEAENFKVIRNISPPGGPVNPGQEELDSFEVIKNSPPPGGPVNATDEELENFRVIPNSPPTGG